MPDHFPYDVFLSHSSKDKAVVRFSSLSASNRERAGVRCRIPSEQAAFTNYDAPEAREILNELMEKEDRINGMDRMTKPGSTRGRIHPANPVHPVGPSGGNEIVGKFGGADQLRNAVNQLQSLPDAA